MKRKMPSRTVIVARFDRQCKGSGRDSQKSPVSDKKPPQLILKEKHERQMKEDQGKEKGLPSLMGREAGKIRIS